MDLLYRLDTVHRCKHRASILLEYHYKRSDMGNANWISTIFGVFIDNKWKFTEEMDSLSYRRQCTVLFQRSDARNIVGETGRSQSNELLSAGCPARSKCEKKKWIDTAEQRWTCKFYSDKKRNKMNTFVCKKRLMRITNQFWLQNKKRQTTVATLRLWLSFVRLKWCFK